MSAERWAFIGSGLFPPCTEIPAPLAVWQGWLRGQGLGDPQGRAVWAGGPLQDSYGLGRWDASHMGACRVPALALHPSQTCRVFDGCQGLCPVAPLPARGSPAGGGELHLPSCFLLRSLVCANICRLFPCASVSLPAAPTQRRQLPGPLLRPQLRSSPSRDPAMCQTPRGPPCRAGWSGSPLRVPVSGRVSENRADPQLAVCSVIRFPPPRNECALPHHCSRVSKEPIFPPRKLDCVRRGY